MIDITASMSIGPTLGIELNLERCPHCNIDKPSLKRIMNHPTKDYQKQNERWWATYSCVRCGGVVTACALSNEGPAVAIYPQPQDVDESIPARAREYLKQAIGSISSPAGSVMLSASAVDSMLKEKRYTEGSLYSRIDKAAKEHLITEEMATWAHKVRIEANDQRHADLNAPLPSSKEAESLIEFAKALGIFLFVLPDRVKKGITNINTPETNKIER
jgi:glutaredoxin